MKTRTFAATALGSIALVLACTSTREVEQKVLPPVAAPLAPLETSVFQASAGYSIPKSAPEEHEDIHNLYELSDQIVSGSEPHGEEAFRILQAKGVKTILSVDGKVPDEELAAKYGMKYVHVPIQYKGITPDEIGKIAKTFREQEGPFFVHCFHGKHRGPAAAEIGRLVLDGVSRETAVAEMRQCGTAETYEGLYATIARAQIPSASETAALDFDFAAASPLDGIAGAMVVMSRADDNLKALAKNKWQPDAAHPDADALNEATKLASAFERSLALPDVAAQPEDFRQWMLDSKEQSAALRAALAALKEGTGTVEARIEAADKAYKTLAKTCTACHDIYRN